MLAVGKKEMQLKGLDKMISMQNEDSENLSFDDESFDAITARGFGVRNFENSKGLMRVYRGMKKGGKVVILEPSEPNKFPFKQIYSLYFKTILPFLESLFLKMVLHILIYQHQFSIS